MENASKALIIAGSLLISLVIAGALVLMFSNLSAYQDTNTQTTREAQIQAFNQDFLTYNRKNVRGNEILTLINKVVDYNERKSLGTEANEIKYEPMKIIIHLDYRSELTLKASNELFTQTDYTQDDNNNKLGSIIDTCQAIEKTYTSTEVASKLVTNITNLYDIDESNATQVADADKLYDSIIPRRVTKSRIDAKNDIYKYYEYVQFKRAYFDPVDSGLKYNNGTGRVTQMEFRMTGKFE